MIVKLITFGALDVIHVLNVQLKAAWIINMKATYTDHQDLKEPVDKNPANKSKKNNHIKITHTEEIKNHQDQEE